MPLSASKDMCIPRRARTPVAPPTKICKFLRGPFLALGANGRQAGHCGHHDARQQLHGRDVAVIEGIRSGREDFEQAQRSPEMTERRDQDRSGAQPATAGEVDARVRFCIVAEKNFSRA